MAANTTKKYPLGSPQEHIEMCGTHELPIDMICEDCDEFICGDCAKSNHRDHNWKTISTAATQRRRGLLKFLKKIKEENLHTLAEKLKKIPRQITENKQLCDSEIKRLQKHYEDIIARLTEIRIRHEKTMKDNLIKKNDELNHVKSELEKTKRGIVDTVEFMEENNSTMSDYSLIDNHRELTKMLSELEVHITNCEHSVSCLSPSGSVSTVISTDPLVPYGICKSVDGGLLVTLTDEVSDDHKLESHSRRLVSHITVTGDVIHEYEYQEDGQTRLFTEPYSVTQNSNSDICVVNRKSHTTRELVILSPSGRMKSVYRGQNLAENFCPHGVVCDSLGNILVNDPRNKQIHLLSPDGEFLKFLLTDNEVNYPSTLSLYKSTLWVGCLRRSCQSVSVQGVEIEYTRLD
ncbi:uncharacterized protein LOC134234772 [Saccostrea cucullata]|uniref:uncharacterized protein LOC134234772 n=1 Tax=Saccostrea cuccullata TaxID=36930 RepID=UPI002ED5F34A